MGLNIKLYVHGVPLGQKIWGTKEEDNIYFSSFYGPKWDVPEVMKIDIMTFGNITYCYYSFVKGKDVYDSHGREGAYFALTLRINALYTDVQNIYNILKATYDKMCVGLCIGETNGSSKFLIEDFQIIDSQLKSIESQILHYISDYSVGEDIINLTGSFACDKGVTPCLNLHECNRSVAAKIIRQNGSLLVSPWYLSSDTIQQIDDYKAQMQLIRKNADQEIQNVKNESQRKLNEIVPKTRIEAEGEKLKRPYHHGVREDVSEFRSYTPMQKIIGACFLFVILLLLSALGMLFYLHQETISEKEEVILDLNTQIYNLSHKDDGVSNDSLSIEKDTLNNTSVDSKRRPK